MEAVDLKDTEKLEEVVGRHKVVLHVAGVSLIVRDAWSTRSHV